MSKYQILTFDGGLQTTLQEHLVDINQAVVCKNVNLSKGSLFPYYGLEANGTALGKYIHFNNGTLIQNTDEADVRSYATFGNRIYWTDGEYSTVGLRRYDGTNAGVEASTPDAPDGTMTLTPIGTNGNIDGDYVYTYTYVDTDGIESAPSGYFTVTTTDLQNISISIGSEANTPVDIAYRKIYRTGGNNPTFNLIAELPNPTLTYTDLTRDIDVSRIELSTFINSSTPQDLTNLIENNGTFWGSSNNRVYFSSNGQPEYWNELDFLQLNDECTGLGKFSDLVVAFTKSDTYVISGYNRDTVAVRLLPYREGCIGHNTIANVGEYLLWASYNGICIFDGSTVDVLTKNVLSWNKQVEIGDLRFGDFGELRFDSNVGYKIDKAIGIDGHYYAIYQDGVLDIDVLNKSTSSTIYLENAYSIYYDDDEDVINIIDSDLNIYMFDSDTDNHMSAIWKTGKIQGSEGYSFKKQYRKIEFDDIVDSVIVTVDDKKFTANNTRQFFLPHGYVGNTIQLEIVTDREIRSCLVQYGVLR